MILSREGNLEGNSFIKKHEILTNEPGIKLTRTILGVSCRITFLENVGK